MLFLSSVAATQPDPVAGLMVLALAIVVAVMALRKRFAPKKPSPLEQLPPDPIATRQPTQPTAPGSAGKLKLHDVEPKTAAMLMAITADKLGKPLNELRFISIREVK